MLPNVGDDVETVGGDFLLCHVDEEGSDDFDDFEALDYVVLVGAREAQVAHYEHQSRQVLQQGQLRNLLVQHCDNLLPFLPQLF